MWVKVDDRFPEHPKVFAAAEHLGQHATGRVLAVWLEAMCWTNSHRTDGFLPLAFVRSFKHDRQPLKVVAAMSQMVLRPDGSFGPGLLVEVHGGYRVHDYGVHNNREKFEATSAARAEAGRTGGHRSAEAKRQAKFKQLLEATASSNAANVNPGPVPVPEDPKDQDPGADAPDRSRPEKSDINRNLLFRLVEKESLRADIAFDGEADFREHVKTVAAKSGIPYDGPAMIDAIDAVLAKKATKARRSA